MSALINIASKSTERNLFTTIRDRLKTMFIEKGIRGTYPQSTKFIELLRTSRLVNIYHCCTHKSGSQWLKQIFNDPDIFKYCSLRQYTYSDKLPGKLDDRRVKERCFHQPFPEGVIVSPLYISYDNFIKTPKKKPYKAVFIQRDPRDLIISYYFSMKYSHSTFAPVNARRQKLRKLNKTEGLIYCLDHLIYTGTIEVLQSWNNINDKNVLVLRYEDLIGYKSYRFFKLMFDHCEIHIADEVLHDVLKKYEFKSLSNGRKPGQENIYNHYRKGIAGDWKNHFTEEVKQAFKVRTKRLIIDLSYENNENW